VSRLLTRCSWLVVAVALLLPACIPPEPDDDAIVKYDPEETVMGEIQERGELIVGTPKDRPPFDGFTFGFGRLVADALGVEAREVPLPPGALIAAPEEGVVDISFPLATVTERLVRHYAVLDPFYIAHQRLLVPNGSGIGRIDDLNGIVCQYIDARTGVNVAELNPDARPIAPPEPETCLRDMRRETTEGLSAGDWLLYPLLATGFDGEIVGDELTTEAYGPVIESGASAWADFVEGILTEADAEGDWQRLYDEWFGSLSDDEVTFPDMTVEEAAALFPSDVFLQESPSTELVKDI
jgi:polar amino acid transport system substrate-binding protein